MTEEEITEFEFNELPQILIDNIRHLARINKALSEKSEITMDEIQVVQDNIYLIDMMAGQW